MPRFQPLSPERIAELTTRRGPGVVDLTEYKSWIDQAQRESQGWGEIQLAPTDNVRSIKRRTTIAGKELARVVKWHRHSTKEVLLFRVVEPGSIRRRPRRTPGSS